MRQQPSLTEIQRRYIDTVNRVEPRYRALVRSTAERRALRDLRAWGFSAEQAYQLIDDARAIEVLERMAR